MEFDPLEPQPGETLADSAYRVLRAAIDGGRIASGERLIETELAAALGVSRTPLREALHRLTADGSVESSPHRGFVVVDLLEDASTVYLIRERLEGLAAALAAHRITVAQLDALEAVQAEMERRLGDEDPSNLAELARLNGEFHRGINDAAGSPRLLRLIGALTPAYVSHQVVVLYTPEERQRSFAGHRLMLDALFKRDADAADRLVQEHLENGKTVVLRELRGTNVADAVSPSGAATLMKKG